MKKTIEEYGKYLFNFDNEENLEFKINTCLELVLINLIDLYNKPSFKKFDLVDFHTRKSKLYFIVYNLLDIQKYILTEPIAKDIIKVYLDRTFEENRKVYAFIEFVNDFIENIEEGTIYSVSDIIGEIKQFIWETKKDSFDDLIAESNVKESIDVSCMTLEEFLEYLNKMYNLLLDDTQKFYNLNPEYKSNFIQADLDITESLKKYIYREVESFHFPITENELNDFEEREFRRYNISNVPTLRSIGPIEFISEYSYSIMVKIFNLLPYTRYSKKVNYREFI